MTATFSIGSPSRDDRRRPSIGVLRFRKDTAAVSERNGCFDVDPLLAKVQAMIDALGSRSAAADHLGVARNQPGRWLNGTEAIPRDVARRLCDFDWVRARRTSEISATDARIWLRSPNTFLNATEPLTWLRHSRPEQVIRAVDGEAAGAYA